MPQHRLFLYTRTNFRILLRWVSRPCRILVLFAHYLGEVPRCWLYETASSILCTTEKGIFFKLKKAIIL